MGIDENCPLEAVPSNHVWFGGFSHFRGLLFIAEQSVDE